MSVCADYALDEHYELRDLGRLGVRQWGWPTGTSTKRKWRTRMSPGTNRATHGNETDQDWWLVTEFIDHPDPDKWGVWQARAVDRNGIPWRGDLS